MFVQTKDKKRSNTSAQGEAATKEQVDQAKAETMTVTGLFVGLLMRANEAKQPADENRR